MPHPLGGGGIAHASPAQPEADGGASPARTGNERGWVASGTVILSTGLGLGKSWILDRARLGAAAVLQAKTGPVRLGPAIVGTTIGVPLAVMGALDLKRSIEDHGVVGALQRGDTIVGAAEAAGGLALIGGGLKLGMPAVKWRSLLLDMFRGPTTASVPISGGWRNVWGKTYRASNVIGASLGTLGMIAGVANLTDAINRDGPAGVVNSRSGRTGALGIVGAGIGFGFAGWAGKFHRLPSQSFMDAAIGAEWLSKPGIRNIGYIAGTATGLLTIANELGALDGLNRLFRGKDSA